MRGTGVRRLSVLLRCERMGGQLRRQGAAGVRQRVVLRAGSVRSRPVQGENAAAAGLRSRIHHTELRGSNLPTGPVVLLCGMERVLRAAGLDGLLAELRLRRVVHRVYTYFGRTWVSDRLSYPHVGGPAGRSQAPTPTAFGRGASVESVP